MWILRQHPVGDYVVDFYSLAHRLAVEIDVAIGLMYALHVQASRLTSTPLHDGSGLTAGPSYEYVYRYGAGRGAHAAGSHRGDIVAEERYRLPEASARQTADANSGR